MIDYIKVRKQVRLRAFWCFSLGAGCKQGCSCGFLSHCYPKLVKALSKSFRGPELLPPGPSGGDLRAEGQSNSLES